MVNDRMEAVCIACGLIQRPENVEAYLLRVGGEASHTSALRRVGLAHEGSLIGFEGGLGSLGYEGRRLSSKLEAKFLRLQRLQRLQPRMGRAESFVEGERALLRACTCLELPSPMLLRALHLYRRALHSLEGRAPSRPTIPALAAACLTVALSSWGRGAATSREVIKVFKALGHRVGFNSLSRATSWVKRALSLKVPLRHPSTYLPFIVEEALARRGGASAEVKADVLRIARRLLDRLPQRAVGGRAPRIMAAAAVYGAVKVVERRLKARRLVTQKTLSEVVNAAEYSIRAHYSKLFKPLLEEVA